MQELFALAQKIAPCDVNVLITGETGTGKELLARAIHKMSGRSSRPLVAFSCANLPETLIEDELFGHEKGAFTGALMCRRGRMEAADTGTMFLDEIGDFSLGLQPKLLRVLQERSFERLGSNAKINVNIRLICATNRNLAEMVQQGKFRDDLYYRLNVVQMHLPPLRERRDDIPLLAQHFLQDFSERFKKKAKRFSQPALRALEEYGWPGNVRELENAVQRAVVLSEGPTVDVWQLPAAIRSGLRGSSIQPILRGRSAPVQAPAGAAHLARVWLAQSGERAHAGRGARLSPPADQPTRNSAGGRRPRGQRSRKNCLRCGRSCDGTAGRTKKYDSRMNDPDSDGSPRSSHHDSRSLRISACRFLRNAQNADGGWGFHPGSRAGWSPRVGRFRRCNRLGMTRRIPREIVERGFQFLRAAQLADGSWAASAERDGRDAG